MTRGGSSRPWVDSHCHLQFLPDGGGPALARARAAGVDLVVCVGTDAASSREAVELAGSSPAVRATVGLHPHDASAVTREWSELEALTDAPRVVAIGETGLDLHYLHSPPAAQEEAFRAQLALARDRDLAVVVHSRDAWDRTFEILEGEGAPACTILHCFTGGPVEAARAARLGAYVSFSGIVTFRNADEVRRAAALVAPDRLLVETDAPYLAPVPHRGSPNEPAWVPDVGAAVAAARGVEPSEVARLTSANARRAFGLGVPDPA